MRQAPSVTAIIAAYNEEDVIGAVVADLLDQGVRVHLLDHASTDGTVAEVERLKARGSLTIERLDGDEFSLDQIIRRKEILAAELDSDWFVNADADEFRESPWPGVSFVEGLREVDRLGFNAVDFAVLNFLPVDDAFRKGDDPRQAFRFCEPAGAFDRLQIRCWKKQPGPLDLASTAGHEARFPGRRVFPLRFLLRHYPIRSQAHGERKVLQERLPRFAAEERARGWHVQYDAFHEGSSFLRESSSLMPFDPWSTRVALALHHRGVESLEENLVARERELNSVQADLSASRDAAESLRDRVAGLEQDITARRAAAASQDASLESLRRDREILLDGQGGLRTDRDVLRHDQEQLHVVLQRAQQAYQSLRVEHDTLLQGQGALRTERDVFREGQQRLQAELQRVQAAYETLRGQREELLVAHAVAQSQREGALEEREALRLERDGLLQDRAHLLAEHDRLMQIHGGVLVARAVLEAQRDGVVHSREALRLERDGLIENRTRLQLEHERLMAVHGEAVGERLLAEQRLSQQHEARCAEVLRHEAQAQQREVEMQRLGHLVAERDLQISRLGDELTNAAQAHERREAALQYRLETLLRSKVWRWSAPLRALLDGLRRG